MNTEIEKIMSYSSPEVERLLEQKNLELQETAIRKGKFFALKNLPAPTGDFILNYVNELKAGGEQLDAEVNKTLQPDGHLIQGAMLKKETEDKIQKLIEQEAEISNKIHSEEFELNGANPYELERRRKIAMLFLVLLFLSELFYNGKALQVIGDSLIMGLILSFGVSGGVVALAHYSTKFFKQAQSKRSKITIILLTLLVASLVFMGLGYIRSLYSESNGVSISMWIYYIINVLLFIVAWLISYFTFLTPEELSKNDKLVKIADHIKELKLAKSDIAKQIEVMKEELAKKLALKVAVIKYYDMVRKSISKMYRMAVENFKASNMMHRQTPTDCFSQTVPPLNFKSDFEEDIKPANPELS